MTDIAEHDARTLLRRVWSDYLRRHIKVLLIAVVLMVIEGGLLGVLSYMVQPLFDRVFVGGQRDAVIGVAIGVFVLFIVRALSGFGQRFLIIRTGLRVITQIQKDLLDHLLTLDVGFFQANAPGGLIERVRGDAQALQSAASNTLITLGRDIVGLISLLAVAIWIDWVWAAIAFIGVPLVVLPVRFIQRWIRETSRRAREDSAQISTRLDEIFHGMLAIKANTLEEHESTRFARAIRTFRSSQMSSEAGRAALPAIVDLISGIGFLGVLIYGGFQIIDGDKTVGEFMSFFTAMALMFDPLKRLSNVSGQIQAALASLERLYQIFDATTDIHPPADADPADRPDRRGDLVFDNVVFGYNGQPVLRGLSFTARAGETTALVGASGAGKSTVFGLLTRLNDPQSGTITIAARDISSFDLGALRGHFSMVSQDAALFDETIRQNLLLGRLDANDTQVQIAADRASVTDFVAEFPGGLDAKAGPRGSNLSGGQRQRVAIGRAMLRDAPVLLLDEPTSALDARSEAVIQQALDRLSKGRTTLVIAHRLATIRDADKIVVMDRGQVVDEGRHDELLARGGIYANLYHLQFRDGVKDPVRQPD